MRKSEYYYDNICLKVLDKSYTTNVLDFYKRNAEYFDNYEADKVSTFYTENFINNLLAAEYDNFKSGQFVRFFLFNKNDLNTIIGSISFSNIRTGIFNSCSVGYKIDKKYQRQGYAYKMLNLALNIMINDYGMHRIEAYIDLGNLPSINLAIKCRFINEGIAYSYAKIHGTWKDMLRYVYIN